MHLMCGMKPHIRSLLRNLEAGVFSEHIHIYLKTNKKKMWFAALNLMQSVSLVQLSSSPRVGINSRAVLSPEPSRHQVFPATTSSLWEIALTTVLTLIYLDVLHYRRLPRVSSVKKQTKKSCQIHTGLFGARAEQKALIAFIATSRLEWSWCSTLMSKCIHSIRFLICLF